VPHGADSATGEVGQSLENVGDGAARKAVVTVLSLREYTYEMLLGESSEMNAGR
jgi:hypothetical protein